MRLIDADVLLEQYNLNEATKYGNKNAKQQEQSYSTMMLYEFADMIEDAPTAYDIDKVVEELNELDVTAIKRYEGGTFGNYKGTDYYIKKSDAIEIVKQGGVFDDVCEYKNTDDEYCKWKINSVFHETINNPHVAERENIATTKYCPCCGKKIKVV